MKYSSWKRLRNATLPQAVAAYEASPSDPEKAFAFLSAVTEAQDRATLGRLGPQIAAAFARDEKMLGSLANMYSYLCMDEQADDAYLKAVEAGADEEVAAFAQSHMDQRGDPRPKPPNRLLQSFPVSILPGALIGILCFTLLATLSPKIDDAYLINGLERPYTVIVNDQAIDLPPFQGIPATMLRRGDNVIAPGPDAPFQTSRTLRIEKGWSQAFGDDVLVLNPDKAAVLLYERAPYSDSERYKEGYSYAFHVGADHYRFADTDYAFLPFPSELEIPASGSVVYKTRLSAYESREPLALTQTLLANDERELLQAYLKAKISGGDDSDLMAALAATHLDAQDFMAIAELCLASDPFA